MKDLKVGPGEKDKVLIVRYQSKLYAVGNYCCHFGLPISGGQLFDDKVICPFHSAAFSIVTGALENGPAIDGLPTYEVLENEGKAFVKVPAVLPKSKHQTLARREPMDKRRYVIIGGGPAGLLCAETLRQSNFTGEIVIISADDLVPYDRTVLTKGLPNADATKLKLRDEEYLQNADIDIRLRVRAEAVDTLKKSITLSDGTSLVKFILFYLIALSDLR